MPEVETDLASIWWYGYWNFGLKQAELYAQRMQLRFNQLAEHELGRRRRDLGDRLFALPHCEHVIFYRSAPDKAIILRILHHSQDAASHITISQWL